jgi:alpha-1,3-rhamnosyl/mannosyltransferase
LRIVGEGPERGDIESLVRSLGLENSVELRGWVDADEVPAFLQELDVFVMPSVYEGFGLPVLEAMASGIPVVAANRAALPETCGQAALLVDADDEAALADALSAVATDEDLRRALAQAGVERASLFSWDGAAEATDAVIAEVLAAEARTSPRC